MGELMYKGFHEDMTCRGFQYEVGKHYEEDKAELCVTGFHACEYPLDCMNYYTPDDSVYCAVELEDVADETSSDVGSNDTKRVGKGITVKGQLDARSFILEAIAYAKCNESDPYKYIRGKGIIHTKGERSAAEADMCSSIAASEFNATAVCANGGSSIACATGYNSGALTEVSYSIAATTGTRSIAVAEGNCSIAAATLSESLAVTDGCDSVACATCSSSTSIAECVDSVAVSTGSLSDAVANAKNSVAFGYGDGCRVKGELGSWLILVEREYKYPHVIKDIKTFKVDGEKILPNVWYCLDEDGNIKKYKEEEE